MRMQVRSLLRVVRILLSFVLPLRQPRVEGLLKSQMQQCALPTLDCYVLQSVFHVSYLRGLFDENSFTTRDMDNLDGDSPRLWSPDGFMC